MTPAPGTVRAVALGLVLTAACAYGASSAFAPRVDPPGMPDAPGGGPRHRRPAAEISGRVLRAEDRAALRGAEAHLVDLAALTRALVRDPAALGESVPGRVATSTTDEDGRWVFHDVSPGAWAVTIRAPGREPGSTGQFVIGDAPSRTCEPVQLRALRGSDEPAEEMAAYCPDDQPELLSTPFAATRDSVRRLDGRTLHRVERGPRHVLLGSATAEGTPGDLGALDVLLPPEAVGPDARVVLVSRSPAPGAGAPWRYVGSGVRTAAAGEVRFESVPAGRYFLCAGEGGSVRAAGFVDVARRPGEVSVLHPEWERVGVAAEAEGDVDASALSCVSFFDRGHRPALDRSVASRWGVADVLEDFPARRHRLADDGVLWVARDPQSSATFTSQSGARAGSAHAAMRGGRVAIPLGPGWYVNGRTPQRAADLLLCSSDGWSELALLPRTSGFTLGPYPSARYVATAFVVGARAELRMGLAGFTGAADGAGGRARVEFAGLFGSLKPICVFGWPPEGCDAFVYRDDRTTGALPCERDDNGFATALLDRKARSATVLFVPRKRMGPSFGVRLGLDPGRPFAEFPAPRVRAVRIDDARVAAADVLQLTPVEGPDARVFIQPWSHELGGAAAVELPCVPVGSYDVRCFDEGREIGGPARLEVR